MSAEDRKRLELWLSIVIAFVAVATALHGFVVLPDRVDRDEQDIKAVQSARLADHDLLLEIRGDVKALREQKK
jgi:hypothetical protein